MKKMTTEFLSPSLGILTIRAASEFTVFKNGELVAPDTSTSRKELLPVLCGDEIVIYSDDAIFTSHKELPLRYEYPDPESMCEVVPANELSMFDRLRSEMQQMISAYAESKGLDTPDDEDYEDDYDDDSLIDTPYEYTAMRDEYLAENDLFSEEAQPPLAPNAPEAAMTPPPEPAPVGGSTQI